MLEGITVTPSASCRAFPVSLPRCGHLHARGSLGVALADAAEPLPALPLHPVVAARSAEARTWLTSGLPAMIDPGGAWRENFGPSGAVQGKTSGADQSEHSIAAGRPPSPGPYAQEKGVEGFLEAPGLAEAAKLLIEDRAGHGWGVRLAPTG